MPVTERRAGLLLHPTSLPGGTLAEATRWLDFLQASGFGVWQVLPLGLPLTGLSPYQCASAFAVNPALFPRGGGDAGAADRDGFLAWRQAQAHWLDDFALFMVIKHTHDGRPWTDWPAPLRDRDADALRVYAAAHAQAIEAVMLGQYRAHLFWQELRAQARQRGIRIFGDMPLFIAHDSADVWAYRAGFLLEQNGQPGVVAGVPPDYFSATGQRWGNPLYDWDTMRADGFAWWRARLAAHFAWFDLVRIDHFRGLAAAWAIPAADDTAVNGRWTPSPGAELLQAVTDKLGRLPLVAEDLGIITDDVTALRKQFHLPGMAVLQFAFDGHADNPHRPENVGADTVYYLGTHDNDTTAGWWESQPDEARARVRAGLGVGAAENVPAAMQAALLDSRASLAVLTLQDVLSLGSEARMNTPGTAEGNWQWRFEWNKLNKELAQRLLHNNQQSERCEHSPKT